MFMYVLLCDELSFGDPKNQKKKKCKSLQQPKMALFELLLLIEPIGVFFNLH